MKTVRARRPATARELASRHGVSPRTVRRMIAEQRSDYVNRAQERREQIVALRRQGLSHQAIAAKLGVTRPLVTARLAEARRAGVDVDPPKDQTA